VLGRPGVMHRPASQETGRHAIASAMSPAGVRRR
jgi:hypothetical protein